jgi:hypothetical protein
LQPEYAPEHEPPRETRVAFFWTDRSLRKTAAAREDFSLRPVLQRRPDFRRIS